MQKQKYLFAVAPLFLVLLIDGMGLGLLIPILNSVIIDPSTAFLTGVSEPMRDFLYGLILGVFMICWFFGAAILGDLSDSTGRRKALVICLLGAFLGYFISAIAIPLHMISLLIIGRMIAGFTAGSQPIAQAAIIDVSPEEHKARNIGFVQLAISIGFVCGPIIGGLLSDSSLSSWFSFSTPLYFAALISLLNAGFLLRFFTETFHKHEAIKIELSRAVSIFVSAFQHKKIGQLAIVLFIMFFGWSNYFSFISMYLYHQYHFHELQNSLFLTVMALGFSLGCGYIVDFCAKRFHLKWPVVLGLMTTALGVLITLLWNSEAIAYAMTFVSGAGMGVAYSIIIALFSNQVNEDEQGWIMGVTGAITALCFGLTSLSAGLMATIGVATPLVLAIFGLACSGMILVFVKVK